MELKCNTLTNDGDFVRCWAAATKYYSVVKALGGGNFSKAQAAKACVKWHKRMNDKGC